MILRASLVVLAVLNLGAGLWWATHREAPAEMAATLPAGVARLQLWSEGATAAPSVTPVAGAGTEPEAPAASVPSPAPKTLPSSEPAAVTPAAQRCYSFGPYPDIAAAQAALAKLGNQVAHSRLRQLPAPTDMAESYRVFLPSAPDAAAATATARKLSAAGIGDYYVIRGGDNANAIALGLYRKREGAESRLAALRAAGIEAKIETIGGAAPPPQWRVDVAAIAGNGPAPAGGKRQPLDCTTLR